MTEMQRVLADWDGTDAALAVAKWRWPDVQAWRIMFDGCVCDEYEPSAAWFNAASHENVAAAERVVVERGLSYKYGIALLEELGIADARWPEEAAAIIRTAPLEVCLRALARVARAQQTKEKA